MDYVRARDRFEKHKFPRLHDFVKLQNKTYLFRAFGTSSDIGALKGRIEPFYYIELFQKRILEFHADGNIVLNDHGDFARTTHDRYNQYLPRDFRVWGETIRGLGLVGFLRTPKTTIALCEKMTVHEDGSAEGGAPIAVVRSLPGFINLYMQALCRGQIERPRVASNEITDQSIHQKLLNGAIALYAVENPYYGRLPGQPHLKDFLRLHFKDGYIRTRKPRTRAQAAERMECLIKYNSEEPLPTLSSDAKKLCRIALRQEIIRTVTASLGIELREWNRRDS